MDFKAKNFSYASMPFGDFTDAVERGERLYLRALSSKNAKENPTILEDDYPSIASSFKLPGKPSGPTTLHRLSYFPALHDSFLLAPKAVQSNLPTRMCLGSVI
jgi:hypothetical protein